MGVHRTAAQRFGIFFFFACVAAVALGLWYVQHGGFWEDQQDADDDEEEPTERPPDAGAHRRRPKKSAPAKKKTTEGRQARNPPVRQGGASAAAGPTGPSYESAIAGNNLKLAPGTKDVPDLTDAQLAGPMRDGTFLDACGVPASTHVTVKVAIQNGRSVGISVYPVPASPEIAGCVERHVRSLQWPVNAKMDSFVTTY